MTDRYLDKQTPLAVTGTLDATSAILFASTYGGPPNRLQNAARIDGPIIALATSTFTSFVLEQATAAEFRSLTGRLGWRVAESGLIDPLLGSTHAINQANMREHLLSMNSRGQLQVGEKQILNNISRRGALKGFASAGLAIGANIAMDCLIFKEQRYGTASAIADGLVVPGLALAPVPWHLRGPLMCGAHVTGRLIDARW